MSPKEVEHGVFADDLMEKLFKRFHWQDVSLSGFEKRWEALIDVQEFLGEEKTESSSDEDGDSEEETETTSESSTEEDIKAQNQCRTMAVWQKSSFVFEW